MAEEKPSESFADVEGIDSGKSDVGSVNKSNPEARTKDSLDPGASGDDSHAVENPALTDSKSEDEQLTDLVVLDNVDSSPPRKDIRQQPKCQTKDDSKDLQSQPEDTKGKPNSKSVKSPDSLSVANNSTDSPGPVQGGLKSLKSESFVLQLAPSDALDSDLDTTAEQSACEKPKNELDCAPNEGADTGDMKETDSNQSNVPASKVAESEKVYDSLILTADDELEAEMLTDKNEKPQDEGKTSGEGKAKKDVGGAYVDRKNEPSDAVSGEVKKNGLNCEKGAAKGDKQMDNIKKSSHGVAKSSKILWVSNITQAVKATDLKQYISKTGKVTTAKVVTDGKKCYGYVVMENAESASRCVKLLNNANFEGRRISFSFTRPSKTDRKKDPAAKADNEKPKPVNDSDSGAEDAKPSKKAEVDKRHRSPSHANKRPNDPLTTKFERGRARSSSRRSRSSDRNERLYLREKLEKERLQRKLVEEQRRHREEIHRHMLREEKQREKEFKVEQDRRNLQLERELFEKERREMTRLDYERRKIEKERLELLQQRSKLETEMQKSRMTRKTDEFTLSSVITKPPEMKPYEKREALKDDYRKPRFQKDDRKIGDGKTPLRSMQKQERSPKDCRGDSKGSKRGGDDFKSYERTVAPPPPKINSNDELGFPPGRKPRHGKFDYPESYGDKKNDRGGRKIEAVDRKFYPGSEGGAERKDRVYRKPEFVERKAHVFPERKYEYGRDTKRYRDESYPERDNAQRTQWTTQVSYNDPWKPLPSTPAGGSSGTARYQESNFSSSSTQPFGGQSRAQQFYYPPAGSAQEYPRYDNSQQVHGRKY